MSRRAWVALLLAAVLSLPVTAIAAKLPKMVGLTTYSAGSKMYAISTGIAHAIEKKSGIVVRVVPAGTNRAKALSLIRKEAVLSVGFENGWYGIQGGIWDFAEDGPQDLRMAWAGAPGCTSLIVTKESGIKTMADLKGKRVGFYGDYDPATNALVTGFLAYGDLTWDDVKPYSTTYGKGMDALLDDKVDAAYFSPAGSKVYELDATPRGAAVIELPPGEKDKWKKLNKIAPMVAPGKVPIGYGATKANPRDWPIYTGYLMTNGDSDIDLIAALVKATAEGYDDYKAVHPEAPYWTVENALDINYLKTTGWAYHPGAVKAFKELGLWTDELQAWQDSRVEFSKNIKKEYQKVVDEAKAKSIKVGSDDFVKMWEPRWTELRGALAE